MCARTWHEHDDPDTGGVMSAHGSSFPAGPLAGIFHFASERVTRPFAFLGQVTSQHPLSAGIFHFASERVIRTFAFFGQITPQRTPYAEYLERSLDTLGHPQHSQALERCVAGSW